MSTILPRGHLGARLAIVGLAGVTGCNYLVMKITVAGLTPLSLIFWRFAFATVFLALFSFGTTEVRRMKIWREGGAAGVLLGVALLLLGVAIQVAGSGETAFWVSSDAAFVPIISYAVFKAVPGRPTVVGIVLALVGLGMLSLTTSLEFRTGSVMGILSAVSFAFWIVALEGIAKRHSAVALGFVQMTAGLVVSGVCAYLAGSLELPSSLNSWICCLYLGTVGTGLRFAIQSHVQRTVSATETALIYLIEPVFAAILGAVFLSEVLTNAQCAGCVLILAGIAISQVARPKAADHVKTCER